MLLTRTLLGSENKSLISWVKENTGGEALILLLRNFTIEAAKKVIMRGMAHGDMGSKKSLFQ